MTFKHISVDIETLGTRANSVVLSIGAVRFCGKALASNETERFGEEFYAVLEIESQLERGRLKDDDTVAWWEKQSSEAKAHAYSNKKRRDTNEVLSELYDFIIGDDFIGDSYLWGNGSDFDNTIIADLFLNYGYELPWSFWNNRCFRTFKSEFKSICSEPLFEGVKHHALHDAKHQARWLQQIKSKINRNIALY